MNVNVATHRSTAEQQGRDISVFAGIFFLSLSVLVYEIALTRVFAVLLTYHYVFLVISTALLGLAFGGILDDRLHSRRAARGKPEPPLSRWTVGTALTMAASVFVLIGTGESGSLLWLILVASLPFFFSGVVLAAAFRRFAEQSARLYAFDLAGAALGSLGVVAALNSFGGINTLLFSAVLSALASLLLSRQQPRKPISIWLSAATLAATAVLFGLNISRSVVGDVPIGRSPDKELYSLLSDPSMEAEIVETRWSAFGRTDLVRQEVNSDLMGMYIDGAAGTSMFRWNGSLEDSTGMLPTLKFAFSGSFPLALLDDTQRDNALIIGPGGGRDVLVNLLWGVREITAVEVNPDFVALMRKYEDYNGGLYTRVPNVKVVVEEGRNFLKRAKEKYDIIMLTLPITKSSRSFQGYALTENFLYTKESFLDYFNHLTPEGRLIMVAHSLPESVRLVTTAMAAFQEMGIEVTEAMKQVYVLGDPRMPVVVIQMRPLEESFAGALHSSLHLAGFDGRMSYVPYARQRLIRLRDAEADTVEGEWLMMNQMLIDLAEGEVTLDELIHELPIDLSPSTDDRPFFFKYNPGLPTVLRGLFWLSFFFLGGILWFPATARRRIQRRLIRMDPYQAIVKRPAPASIRFLFLGIGMGFMLVEVSVFHRLLLFLGKPTIALALLLFSLLLGTGLGSLASSRVKADRLVRGIWLSALVTGIAVVFSAFTLRGLFESLLDLGVLRFVVAAVIVMLLGFPMGFPFPLGLRLLKEREQESEVPWMWAINGAASVFGAVLAISLAVLWGYSVSLWFGGLMYLLVALVIAGKARLLRAEEVDVAAPAAVSAGY
jgi:predicted membrane-bound spermidine synthase/MFS family permease